MLSEFSFSNGLLSDTVTTKFLIFGLARLTWICNPSADSETSLNVNVMRDLKSYQETKRKQTFFANIAKKVGSFLKTGSILIPFDSCLFLDDKLHGYNQNAGDGVFEV